jgi:hypothetical protein
MLKKLSQEGLDNWELKVLDMVKFDYSSYKFD